MVSPLHLLLIANRKNEQKLQVYIFNILMSANICNVKLNLSELSLGGMIWGKFYNVKQAGQSDVPWHSRTVPDILISYNSYVKGVSCPTVHWFNFHMWLVIPVGKLNTSISDKPIIFCHFIQIFGFQSWHWTQTKLAQAAYGLT